MQVLIPAVLSRVAARPPVLLLLPFKLGRILIHQLEPADVLPACEAVRHPPDSLIISGELREEGVADDGGGLFDEWKVAKAG